MKRLLIIPLLMLAISSYSQVLYGIQQCNYKDNKEVGCYDYNVKIEFMNDEVYITEYFINKVSCYDILSSSTKETKDGLFMVLNCKTKSNKPYKMNIAKYDNSDYYYIIVRTTNNGFVWKCFKR